MSTTRNDGRAFEKNLETINQQYERRGRATISKVEPPCRIIGWGPARKVIFLENPYPDFLGCLHDQGGRMIAFEAKSTSEPRLANDKGHLSDNQLNALRRWRAAGAATFLLWEYQGVVTFWTTQMIQAGLTSWRSLIFDDGHQVEAGQGFIFYDYLATARRFGAYL